LWVHLLGAHSQITSCFFLLSLFSPTEVEQQGEKEVVVVVVATAAGKGVQKEGRTGFSNRH